MTDISWALIIVQLYWGILRDILIVGIPFILMAKWISS